MTKQLPEPLILAVDGWFKDNTGVGGCSDGDVEALAELFYGVHHEGGRESVDDALAVVESFGPGIGGLNDTYARQILLAEEVKRLRAQVAQELREGFTAADMATASARGFRDGVASISAPLQSALDVIERWARDAYVVCGKPSTQEGFEAAWEAEDADAYGVWSAGRASLSANAGGCAA